ncbi:mechanosensitive ion channel domain-containing protein [Parvularcula marina]|uniref:mechanosensitive ion channel domain-containing protein n=1 Tax=Parvularcula marina TaxID=2292771 RepID=UPI003512A6E7
MDNFSARFAEFQTQALDWLSSPAFYTQAAIVVACYLTAFVLSAVLGARMKHLLSLPVPKSFGDISEGVTKSRALLFPLISILLLAFGMEVAREMVGQVTMVRIARGLTIIFFLYGVISRFINSKMMMFLMTWVGVPLALLYVFGLLDEVRAGFDTVAVDVGNIHITAWTLVRTLFFGAILFWLGRVSNSTGKKVIRGRQDFDNRTREIVTKLFEIGLFVIIFLLLLQVMGINLTTLAVFGGAVGVGLGFGLQQIASNFISGIIILLDKSLDIGDYVELEDGRGGILRELTMRSATLETFDGKDIMVPNETFITTAFTNWTHNNPQQRYDLTFSVAYSTDIPAMLDIVREVVRSHPQVLSGDAASKAEQPDAEIESFGDSGINILVEFWMNGVDDGENRVGADLNLMIWMALKQHNIEIPFPQREIRVLKEEG